MNRRELVQCGVTALLSAALPVRTALPATTAPNALRVDISRHELARGVEIDALAVTETSGPPIALNATSARVRLRSAAWQEDLALSGGACAGLPDCGPHGSRLIVLARDDEALCFATANSSRVDASPDVDRHFDLTIRRWAHTDTGAQGTTCHGLPAGGHVTLGNRLLLASEPLLVRHGERVGFHVFNSSPRERVSLCLPNHQFRVYALDGRAVARASLADHLVVEPGESLDACVDMNTPGRYVLGSLDRRDQEAGFGRVVQYAGAAGALVAPRPTPPRWNYRMIAQVARQGRGSACQHEILLLPGDVPWHSRRLAVQAGQPATLAIVNARAMRCSLTFRGSAVEVVALGNQRFSGWTKDVLTIPPYNRTEILVNPRAASVEMLTLIPG